MVGRIWRARRSCTRSGRTTRRTSSRLTTGTWRPWPWAARMRGASPLGRASCPKRSVSPCRRAAMRAFGRIQEPAAASPLRTLRPGQAATAAAAAAVKVAEILPQDQQQACSSCGVPGLLRVLLVHAVAPRRWCPGICELATPSRGGLSSLMAVRIPGAQWASPRDGVTM